MSYTPQSWTLTDEHKDVLGYSCQKATARFRGRDYTAWVATDIPISNGPWLLGGAPGLILELMMPRGSTSSRQQVSHSSPRPCPSSSIKTTTSAQIGAKSVIYVGACMPISCRRSRQRSLAQVSRSKTRPSIQPYRAGVADGITHHIRLPYANLFLLLLTS